MNSPNSTRNTDQVEVLGSGEKWKGIPYKELIQNYWNWLLGSKPKKLFYDNLFYMRPNYDFRDSIDEDGRTKRKNFEQVHRENANISTETIIFCPIVDSEFDDGYVDSKGFPIKDEEKLRHLAEIDIGKWKPLFFRVLNLNDKTESEFEPKLLDSGFFELSVPGDSQLAKNLDDPIPYLNHTYKAYAKGYYLAFRIVKEGSYRVTSSCVGPGGDKFDMEYEFNVT
jgi:hypothetical protein